MTAALVAAGLISPGDLVLDVGCGDGEESISLAEHGVCVIGIDRDSCDQARARARRRGVAASTLFLEGDATSLSGTFLRGTFDRVVDVLVYNNVLYAGERNARDYARQAAHVLRPGGLWIIQWRIDRARAKPDARKLREDLPPGAGRWFAVEGVAWTQLPENPQRRDAPAFASIGVAILRRRQEA